MDNWVRTFTVELVETKAAAPRRATAADAALRAAGKIFAPEDHPLAGPLREAFAANEHGRGVVGLPAGKSGRGKHFHCCSRPVARRWRMKESPRFRGGPTRLGRRRFCADVASGKSRRGNLRRECAPRRIRRRSKWIVAEALAADGFTEVHFTGDGRRLEPRLQTRGAFPRRKSNRQISVGPPEDVLLVTGGGKGIAAECALAFARETGVKLALIGRSDPKSDKELADNFSRIAAAGVRSGYVRADVTDAAAVRAAVAEIERNLGPVTAILHGAGVNTPQLIGALDEAAFRRTVRRKFPARETCWRRWTRKSCGCSSRSARSSRAPDLPGEADYATANEWLAALTRRISSGGIRAAAAWRWNGRCGRARAWANGWGASSRCCNRASRRSRWTKACGCFVDLLRQPAPAVSLVVTGRFGEPPTLKMLEPELPLRRFLERKRVFYPGVELVVDAELSLRADPYLADHVVQKQPLLPAVLGLGSDGASGDGAGRFGGRAGV